jgi:hypothetical protein
MKKITSRCIGWKRPSPIKHLSTVKIIGQDSGQNSFRTEAWR